jgi:polyhydroxybutyrate depolymerase
VKLNGCRVQPKTDTLSKVGDEMKVTRETHGGGKHGAEVVLIIIEGGGHTWPGMEPMVGFLGKSALNISANDLMWKFFQRHKLKWPCLIDFMHWTAASEKGTASAALEKRLWDAAA